MTYIIMRRLLLLIVLLASSPVALAQNGLKGRVVETDGTPVIYASVVLESGGKQHVQADVFNTRRWDVHSDNPVFTLLNNSKNRSRMFWLGITWNFHSFKPAKGARKNLEEDRSIIRLGD